MTAQIPDKCFFRDEYYSVIGILGGDLSTPEQFGMQADTIDTSCYRGFYATYELTEESLQLRELTLREVNSNYLPIGGVSATRKDYQASYSGLSEIVPFTGKLRLARNFVREHYRHAGYQLPAAFKIVVDVTLRNGQIVEIKDRSDEAKIKRDDVNLTGIRKLLRRLRGEPSLEMDMG